MKPEELKMKKETERASFSAMAIHANVFINAPEYEAFRELFALLLNITREELQMIADEQSNPARSPKTNINALALQAANLSGQATAYQSILEAPQKFIDKWDNWQKQKENQDKEKTP